MLEAANGVPFWAPKALTVAWAESASTVLLLRNQTRTVGGRCSDRLRGPTGSTH